MRPHGRGPVYRGSARKTFTDVYDADHIADRSGGRFRWLLSTCLAAAVGAAAIGVAILGSLESSDTDYTRSPALRDMISMAPELPSMIRRMEGLKWAAPRTDRLQSTTGASSAKYIIHEQIQVRRDNRPFIQIRPYIRIVARLTPVPTRNTDVIPPFNPFKLYAAQDGGSDSDPQADTSANVDLRVIELLGGILPNEDGQELDAQEVALIVDRELDEQSEPPAIRPSFQPEGAEGLLPKQLQSRPDEPLLTAAVPPNTTVLTKSTSDRDDAEDELDRNEVRVVRASRGDTVVKILHRLGADPWQARAMTDAAKAIFADSQLSAGQEVRVTMVPSLQHPDRMEPAGFSVFGDAHDHKVSVSRNAAGEFVASTLPIDVQLARAAMADSDAPQSSSLYASLYNAALMQSIPPETIMEILRIHAYDTDFRRRVRAADSIEFFFDAADEAGSEPTPGELLYTSLTTGAETQRFWRYRSSDGIVDYYDEFGNNSRKFLMRRPIRGEAVRFSSGFGVRFHPLVNERRMHTGVDWAAPIGTPILAAGNGLIEEADRKGQYGNYVRIRHANGYQTAYAHMDRFGPGIRQGIKVRQGQVIGFVGNTGFSSGPHLHYEVLVNNRFVDPTQIQVPRERRLAGRQAADFQKERSRIEDLMRRPPVMTISK